MRPAGSQLCIVVDFLFDLPLSRQCDTKSQRVPGSHFQLSFILNACLLHREIKMSISYRLVALKDV